jgi:hypothetical protein
MILKKLKEKAVRHIIEEEVKRQMQEKVDKGEAEWFTDEKGELGIRPIKES